MLPKQLPSWMKAEPWDKEKILQECELMFERLNKRYLKGALEFTYTDRPDLVSALQATEDEFNKAYCLGDMANCRRVLSDVEAVITSIVEAFELENDMWPPGRD